MVWTDWWNGFMQKTDKSSDIIRRSTGVMLDEIILID